MRCASLLATLLVGSLFAVANADPLFKITETYIGIDGDDGTEDWIEITNFGDMVGDTGNLLYDDANPALANAGFLDSFMLQPGETAVFLISTAPADILPFTDLWGTGINVGLTNGGGGLGQGGDTVNIGTTDGVSFMLVDSLTYGDVGGANHATLEDPSGMGTPVFSILGVNGAYESAVFLNGGDTGTGQMITLVGSPGSAVPEPTSVALGLLAIASLAAIRRR